MRTLFISLGEPTFSCHPAFVPHPSSCAFSLARVRNESSQGPQASRISLSYLHQENNLGASPRGTNHTPLLGKISSPPPRVRQGRLESSNAPPDLICRLNKPVTRRQATAARVQFTGSQILLKTLQFSKTHTEVLTECKIPRYRFKGSFMTF